MQEEIEGAQPEQSYSSFVVVSSSKGAFFFPPAYEQRLNLFLQESLKAGNASGPNKRSRTTTGTRTSIGATSYAQRCPSRLTFSVTCKQPKNVRQTI